MSACPPTLWLAVRLHVPFTELLSQLGHTVRSSQNVPFEGLSLGCCLFWSKTVYFLLHPAESKREGGYHWSYCWWNVQRSGGLWDWERMLSETYSIRWQDDAVLDFGFGGGWCCIFYHVPVTWTAPNFYFGPHSRQQATSAISQYVSVRPAYKAIFVMAHWVRIA